MIFYKNQTVKNQLVARPDDSLRHPRNRAVQQGSGQDSDAVATNENAGVKDAQLTQNGDPCKEKFDCSQTGY